MIYSAPTKEEIEQCFEGSNFGSTDYENIVKLGLLKVACGYHNGSTLTCILYNLRLILPDSKQIFSLTDKGKHSLYEWFSNYAKEK